MMGARTFTILAFAPALAFSACASPAAQTGAAPAGDEMARLQRDCDARGGILVPTGRLTGQPPLDNICKISGAAATRAPGG